jgi:hypothetical protein
MLTGIACLCRQSRRNSFSYGSKLIGIRFGARALHNAEVDLSSGTWLAPFAIQMARLSRPSQSEAGKEESTEDFLDRTFRERGLMGPGFAKLYEAPEVWHWGSCSQLCLIFFGVLVLYLLNQKGSCE